MAGKVASERTDKERASCVTVPALEPAPLNNEFIVGRMTQVVAKHKPGTAVAPAYHLTETQVVEYEGVSPLFGGVVALRKAFEMLQVFMVSNRIQQLR